MVHPALLLQMRIPRLPVVDWTDAHADLNGLVRFAERRNLISARAPSRFKRSRLLLTVIYLVSATVLIGHIRPYPTRTFNPPWPKRTLSGPHSGLQQTVTNIRSLYSYMHSELSSLVVLCDLWKRNQGIDKSALWDRTDVLCATWCRGGEWKYCFTCF